MRLHVNRWNVAALLIAAALGVLLTIPVLAAVATNYEYRIPVTITNDRTTTLDEPVCAQVNPPGLVAQGFLQSDALDAAGFDVAESELILTRQDPTDAADCWWLDPPFPLLAGQTASSFIHLGATQSGDHDVQGAIRIVNLATTAEQIIYTIGGGGASTNATLAIDALIVDAFPTATSVSIGPNDASHRVEINTSGELEVEIDVLGSADECLFTNQTLTLGAEIDILFTYKSLAAPPCSLSINGAVVDTDTDGAGTDIVKMGAGLFGGQLGFNASVGTITVDGDAASQTMILGFDPVDLAETQVGSAANGFTYTGTIQDQSADNNDGAYTLVRDTASVTVDVGPLQVKGTLPLALVSTDLATVLSLATVNFDVAVATVGSDFGAFTGDDTIERIINRTGANNEGLFLFLALTVGAIIGGAAVRSLKMSAVGLLILGGAIFAGMPLGWYSPGIMIIALMLLFGASGTLAVVGRR